MRLIDVDEIIDYIERNLDDHDFAFKEEIIKMVSRQEAFEWIPCSEELPEDGEYLCTVYSETVKHLIISCEVCVDGEWISVFPDEYVVAWMPMIEVYESGKQ